MLLFELEVSMKRAIMLWLLELTVTLLLAVPTAEAQLPTPTVSPDAPLDVEIPAGFMGDPVAFFDNYSWRTFVALNWPAATDGRGKPDTGKQFGDAAANVVWGTWKADHEVFQPGGMEPSPWDSFAAQSPDKFAAFNDAGKVKVLGGFGARGSDLQIEHYNQAGIAGNQLGTLVGSNRMYVRYEVRINKDEFTFIRDGKFYLAKKLPATGQLTFPQGSGEIKAAWRRFSDAELQNADLLNRYYTTDAVVVEPNGARKLSKVGLVGLHIVRRTPSRREWIWSSFEHVENLSGTASTLIVSQSSPNENKLLPLVDKHNPAQVDPDPVPVRRLRDIRNETKTANTNYQSHPKIKDTVWKNYQLILTQWPRTPAASDADLVANFSKDYPIGPGNPSPGEAQGVSIANVTMETTKLFQQNVSCMQCHFNAGKLMHSEFVWTVPLRAFRENPATSAETWKNLQESVQPLTEAINKNTK